MIDLAMNYFSSSLVAVLGIPFLNLRAFSIELLELFQEMFNIESNGVNGFIPNDLGNLKNLKGFQIGDNYFGNGKTGDMDFLSSLNICSLLQILELHGN
ncbi:hypothetical protein QQP08_005353 [Theobroma cacao]|nr:hypothetical protein QQP08_005353 [Theobroma cacao]